MEENKKWRISPLDRYNNIGPEIPPYKDRFDPTSDSTQVANYSPTPHNSDNQLYN